MVNILGIYFEGHSMSLYVKISEACKKKKKKNESKKTT